MTRPINRFKLELILIAPLILFLFFFTAVPIVRTLIISFKHPLTQNISLVNYLELFFSPAFQTAFYNTLFIALISLFLEIGLGLSLALMLTHNTKFNRWLRSLLILPFAIPTVVVGVIMSYLFSSSGWINKILMDIGLINSPIYWMEGGWRSLIMVVLADAWKVTPIVMLILLAGLQAISEDLYKAARMDGAGKWYIFKRITLPLLLPYLTAAIIIRGIDAFRIFSLPLILMGQNLKVIGTYAYLEYMQYNNIYLSSASAIVLMIIIIIAISIYILLVGRKSFGCV